MIVEGMQFNTTEELVASMDVIKRARQERVESVVEDLTAAIQQNESAHGDPLIRRALLSLLEMQWKGLLFVLFLSLLSASCGDSVQSVTSPSVTGASAASVSSTPVSAPVVEPTTPVAAEPVPSVPNCSEADPKKWTGFRYVVNDRETVTLWNNSPCDRVVTFRAFNAISDSNQPALGDAVTETIPAGAGHGDPGSPMERAFVLKVHYNRFGCDTVLKIQIDGRAGAQPNMTHANADFPPGRLIDLVIPSCAPVPPPTCVEPAFGPWVPFIQPSAIRKLQACQETRTRTRCDGTVERETRGCQ